MGIKQYDTVKDRDGNRYRVTEVGSDGKGHIIAKLKGITPDNKSKRGPARIVDVNVLEEEYTRIDLPPVTVVQPARPAENAMQKQRETVEGYNKEKDVAPTYSQQFHDAVRKAAGQMAEENDQLRKCYEGVRIELIERDKEINKLKAAHDEEVRELEDEIMELKILAKKAGQYSDALDDDSVVFRKIYTLSDAMLDLAASTMKMASAIKDETEGKM